MRRRSAFVTALALASLMSINAPASATTVSLTDSSVSGNTATVSGTAAFPAITTPEAVTGGTKTNWANAATQTVGTAIGLDLVPDAQKIVPISGGLRFIFTVSQMPDPQHGIPHEVMRYNWTFQPNGTGAGFPYYQLEVKRSNIASVSTLEAPIHHVQYFASGAYVFRLRGACVSSYEGLPTNGCYHLAYLTGSVDYANKTISVNLPYETKDYLGRVVAPEIKPGAVLMDCGTCGTSAGMSIAGSLQAVVSNTTTSNFINGWSPYFVGGRVQLAVGTPTSNPEGLSYGPAVALNGSSFTASITGVSATNNTVFARACNGVTCVYASKRVI